MNTAAVEASAERLALVRRERTPFAGFPDELRPSDEPEAYEIQAALFRRLAAGRALAGHKIGCTTPVMQAYLGIDHPCAGAVLADAVHRSPARIACSGFQRLGVECELAVRLGDDLEPAALMAAIEVVEDRYVDFRALDAATLIADGFFGAACVLGREANPELAGDLARASATMSINGVEVGRGEGAHILGEPLAALRWLRAARADQGRPLKPGEIVLLGSLVETRWVEPGDEVLVVNEPLGEVAVRFVA